MRAKTIEPIAMAVPRNAIGAYLATNMAQQLTTKLTKKINPVGGGLLALEFSLPGLAVGLGNVLSPVVSFSMLLPSSKMG